MNARTCQLEPVSQSNCFGCGYPLSGLDDRGSCPECGMYFDRVDAVVVQGVSDRAERVWWIPGIVLVIAAYVMWNAPSFETMVLLGLVVVSAALQLIRSLRAWHRVRDGLLPSTWRIDTAGIHIVQGGARTRFVAWSEVQSIDAIGGGWRAAGIRLRARIRRDEVPVDQIEIWSTHRMARAAIERTVRDLEARLPRS